MGVIDNKDITVVVQGAVDTKKTPICLHSIRKELPGAYIILSTWEGTDVEELEYDEVVFSENPGGFDTFNLPFSPKNNINRQIVSTYNGLLRVKTMYVMKLRTDFYLTGDGFKEYFNIYNRECTEYKIFEHKVICCELYSRNPRYIFSDMKRAYHPSDIFFFGHTRDLVRLFDVPLFSKEDEEYMLWKYYPDISISTYRYDSEAYLWINLLSKVIGFKAPEDLEKYCRADIERSEATFAANLIILSNDDIGLKTLENGIYRMDAVPQNCFTHKDWERLYGFYCCADAGAYLSYLLKIWAQNTAAFPAVFFRKLSSKKCLEKIIKRLKKCLKNYYRRGGCFSGNYRKRKFDKKYAPSYYSEIVDSRDIGVVIQGEVKETTVETVRSIRKHLPGAQVIFSTYNGEDVDGIDADVIVKSEDPGYCGIVRKYPYEQKNNVNRELVTSRAGIEACTARYCIKLRSDMILTGTDFLDIYNRVSKYMTTESVVSRRIMVEALSTSKSGIINFGISNLWFMGLTSDLQRLFSADLYKDVGKRDFKSEYRCNLIPEQHIAYSFYANSYMPFFSEFVGLNNVVDDSLELRTEYERFIANNFVCVEFPVSKVVFPKELYTNNSAAYKCNMSYEYWLKLCRRYGTLDNVVVKRELEFLGKNFKKRHRSNPDYYNILKWSSIARNYRVTQTKRYDNALTDIKPEDMTFLVTGRVSVSGELNTMACLHSIKRFFPGAAIVLGTWDDETVPAHIKKLCDNICFVEKKKIKKISIHLNNSSEEDTNDINMMQHLNSTAIRMVKTKYCVKMDSEYVFKNATLPDFYNYWKKKMDMYNPKYKIFEERVLFINKNIYDGRKTNGKLVGTISDSFQMGRTADIEKIWDGHTESDNVLKYYSMCTNSRYSNTENYNSLYIKEQCHYINLVRNANIKISVPRWYEDDSSFENTLAYEAVLSSNAIIGTKDDVGIMTAPCKESTEHFMNFESFAGLYVVNVDQDNRDIHEYLKKFYALTTLGKKESKAHSILMKALLYGERYGYDKNYDALMKRIGCVKKI